MITITIPLYMRVLKFSLYLHFELQLLDARYTAWGVQSFHQFFHIGQCRITWAARSRKLRSSEI